MSIGGVFGTPEDVGEHLRSLKTAGVTRLSGAYVLSELAEFLERWRVGVAEARPGPATSRSR